MYQLVPSDHTGTVFAPPEPICAPKLPTATRLPLLTNARAPATAVKLARAVGVDITLLSVVMLPPVMLPVAKISPSTFTPSLMVTKLESSSSLSSVIST